MTSSLLPKSPPPIKVMVDLPTSLPYTASGSTSLLEDATINLTNDNVQTDFANNHQTNSDVFYSSAVLGKPTSFPIFVTDTCCTILEIQKRRFYDLLDIFSFLNVIRKKDKKNTGRFQWFGEIYLIHLLAKLQV